MDLDDKLLDHPKFIRAMKRGGSDTVCLWLGLRQWVAQNLTDGFVPGDMVSEVRGPLDARKRAAALEVLRDVGLVDEAPDGLMLHDFLQWSKSRAVILAKREANRLRQEKSRGSQSSTSHVTERVTDSVTARVTNAPVTPLVTTPSPHLSSPHHTTPDESSARAPEVPSDSEPDPRLTICPLDLAATATQVGIVRDFVEKYRVEPEQIREVIREFVSYWSIGGGVGRKHANWPRKLREHLRRACEKPGGLKPVGELDHESHGGNGPSRGVRAAKAAGEAAMALMREAHGTEVR